MKLATLCDKVVARLRAGGVDIAQGGDVNRPTVDWIARETVLAMGLEVNAVTGDIYDPAPAPAIPTQRNVRHAGMRKRGRR